MNVRFAADAGCMDEGLAGVSQPLLRTQPNRDTAARLEQKLRFLQQQLAAWRAISIWIGQADGE